MMSDFEKFYHDTEDRHFWCVGRRELILRLLQRQGVGPGDRVLDIGCGAGALLGLLHENGYRNVCGAEVSPAAIAACRRRGLRVYSLPSEECAISEGGFGAVIASDVLEHIDDDGSALIRWSSYLRPGGVLVVFVPAFLSLWGWHDVINGHRRRYRRADLVSKLRTAGVDVLRTSYWNCAVFPMAWLARRVARNTRRGAAQPRKAGVTPPPAVNAMLLAALRVENRCLQWLDFPFGVSVFCIAVKKE